MNSFMGAVRTRTLIARTAFALAFLALVLQSAASGAADVWYEDNSLGQREIPSDFVEKFRQPETFEQATKHIHVYLMRVSTLQRLDDAFFTSLLFPYLQKNNIKLALNAGGATWAGANERRRQVFQSEIDLMSRLKRLGGRVDYISLQSILSKPRRRAGKDSEIVEFGMDRRVAGAVDFARAARDIYPDVAIGIIDALPAKDLDYKGPYRQLADALKNAGISLSYIHIDVPFEIAKSHRRGVSWASLLEVERFVENDLGIAFGVFATSRQGGMTSSRSYFDGTIGTLDCFAGSGGTPREYIVASWFPYPEKAIPDTATGDAYPTMRVALEFGRRLEEIQKGGVGWVAHQRNDNGWRKECGLLDRN
jgi:hypothetical protein